MKKKFMVPYDFIILRLRYEFLGVYIYLILLIVISNMGIIFHTS